MRKENLPAIGFAVAAALAATPAFAGTLPVPEPEVAGGLVALGILGMGYRLLRRRSAR